MGISGSLKVVVRGRRSSFRSLMILAANRTVPLEAVESNKVEKSITQWRRRRWYRDEVAEQTLKRMTQPGVVAHACDPSNSGERDRRITSLKPPSATKQDPKQLGETLSLNKKVKRATDVVECL